MEILNWLKKSGYLALGHACVALGFIGVFVPGLPTTPFLLVALWAYARSCPHLHDWLLNHKLFGPILQDWQNHGVIPLYAKILAVSMMASSVVLCAWHATTWVYPAIVLACVTPTSIFILTRPSKPQ